jgi:transcriptional regulator NrdR family protein
LICPLCGTDKPEVINTCGFLDDSIPRVRRCQVCGFAFATTETVDQDADFRQRRAEHERKTAEAAS